MRAQAVYGFFPAQAEGGDIILYHCPDTHHAEELCRTPASRRPRRAVVHCLRQQRDMNAGPLLSLADFIAPVDSSWVDYLGAFVVTARHGVDALVRQYEQQNDDYNAIMVKALADRLAEALAERMHEQARRDCGIVESLSQDKLIAEKYLAGRPAPDPPNAPGAGGDNHQIHKLKTTPNHHKALQMRPKQPATHTNNHEPKATQPITLSNPEHPHDHREDTETELLPRSNTQPHRARRRPTPCPAPRRDVEVDKSSAQG